MKAASPALIALLNSSTQFVMADLYTFTLVGGNVLRYSAAPTAIVANGFTFAVGPKFERSKTSTVIGTPVDELDIKVYLETTDLIGGTLWLEAAWQGQLDGALLQIERAFMPSYGDTSPGTVILFAGRISDIDCSRTGIDMKCRSHLGAVEYSDAAATVAVLVHACLRRRDVPVQPRDITSEFCLPFRLYGNPNPQHGQPDSGRALCPGHDFWPNRCECGRQQDCCRNERRERLGQARLPFAPDGRRSVPASAWLRPVHRDLHQRL